MKFGISKTGRLIYLKVISVDTFLKIKQEASGWPSWCRAEEDKREYVREYQEKEGIKLDPENIKKNPGLRSLAKLMLNSFCR